MILFSLLNVYRIRYWVTLKIGRWYEFRILSLNGNGTRGYSTTSQPFQLDESKFIYFRIYSFL